MEGCLACDLIAGRVPLPGGRIQETRHWLVEHCVGPLGIGTLIVKPKRHVVHVSALEPGEAGELGGALHAAAEAVDALMDPEQTYVTLWSHADATPGHIHWVVQPVTRELMTRYGLHGPGLQAAMFAQEPAPDPAAVAAVADRLREWYAARSG